MTNTSFILCLLTSNGCESESLPNSFSHMINTSFERSSVHLPTRVNTWCHFQKKTKNEYQMQNGVLFGFLSVLPSSPLGTMYEQELCMNRIELNRNMTLTIGVGSTISSIGMIYFLFPFYLYMNSNSICNLKWNFKI